MTSIHRSVLVARPRARFGSAFSLVMALLSLSCAELKSVDDSEQWEGPATGADGGTDGDGASDGNPDETDGTSGDGDGGGDGSGDGTTGDGATGDGTTGDGDGDGDGDGTTADGSTGDGSGDGDGDGTTGDGSTGDGSTGDGSTGDGSSGDGSSGDGDPDPGCSGVAAFDTNRTYAAGDRVTAGGKIYECKEHPFSGWCGMDNYEPGTGFAWEMAWYDRGACN